MEHYRIVEEQAWISDPWYRRVTRQEIRLGIPIDQCEPLEGEVRSRAASALGADGPPVVFRVARVRFRFASESYDRH